MYDLDKSTSDIDLKRAYAEGEIGNSVLLKLGAFGNFASKNLTNGGFIQNIRRCGKMVLGSGYHMNKNEMLNNAFKTDKEKILAGGLDYHLDDNLTLELFYSHGDLTILAADYLATKTKKRAIQYN